MMPFFSIQKLKNGFPHSAAALPFPFFPPVVFAVFAGKIHAFFRFLIPVFLLHALLFSVTIKKTIFQARK